MCQNNLCGNYGNPRVIFNFSFFILQNTLWYQCKDVADVGNIVALANWYQFSPFNLHAKKSEGKVWVRIRGSGRGRG